VWDLFDQTEPLERLLAFRKPEGDCLVYGLDCLMCGLDCLMYGLDCLMCGLDCLMYGIDCLIRLIT